MRIQGIAELIFAVEDTVECASFLEDFGLSKTDVTDAFEVVNGARVTLRTLGDSRLPKSGIVGAGVHECIWAVPDQRSLDRLAKDLAQDHELIKDEDGTLHFVTRFGQAIGIRVFQPRPVVCAPSPTNAPGVVNRLNTPRKWSTRAIPKTISHVVFACPDVDEAFAFYRDRLGFRLTDIQKGLGLYLRAPGSTNHHNIFLIDAGLNNFGFTGQLQFHHANFGLEDIDEIMVGKNYMDRRGHEIGEWGFGRHRLSSEAFLYMPSPLGGELEYGADCDQVDDRWRPRIWNASFGAFMYAHNMPEWLKDEPEWDVTYATPETSRFLPAD
jgi:catechol 2,3-dioxygenase-like lactoylglutathione lyase family enzyme